ncbi:MAG: hypothetical protein COB92_06130 [Robiginitomaculum sp.]|nr:MAG: hypothetical protein COB92_06130 [Robiginitomaculum sp.]
MTDKTTHQAIWFRTDIINELEASTVFLYDQITNLSDTHDWRWIIIGGTFLLQGACASALHQSSTLGINCLDDKDLEKWHLHLHDVSGEITRPNGGRVASTRILLNRCIEGIYFPSHITINLEDEWIKDCRTLINFRDKFTHFNPMGGSIEVSGFPRILLNVVTLSEALTEALPDMITYTDTVIIKRILKKLSAIKLQLENIT